MRRRGFTLIEISVGLAAAAVLAGVAWPCAATQWQRAARAEAITALMRLQVAQERHRETFGRYAGDLAAVGQPAASEGGRYAIALALTGAESYRASAELRAGATLAHDRECPALTLEVMQGFASTGPDGRCWNR